MANSCLLWYSPAIGMSSIPRAQVAIRLFVFHAGQDMPVSFSASFEALPGMLLDDGNQLAVVEKPHEEEFLSAMALEESDRDQRQDADQRERSTIVLA